MAVDQRQDKDEPAAEGRTHAGQSLQRPPQFLQIPLREAEVQFPQNRKDQTVLQQVSPRLDRPSQVISIFLTTSQQE